MLLRKGTQKNKRYLLKKPINAQKSTTYIAVGGAMGAPKGSRTPSLQIRSLMLYPVEL